MKLCAQKNDLESGKELHKMIGMMNAKDEKVYATLLHMYCECKSMEDAMITFRFMHQNRIKVDVPKFP